MPTPYLTYCVCEVRFQAPRTHKPMRTAAEQGEKLLSGGFLTYQQDLRVRELPAQRGEAVSCRGGAGSIGRTKTNDLLLGVPRRCIDGAGKSLINRSLESDAAR